MKKKIVGIFVCMLLIATVLPVSGNVDVESTSMPLSSGNTLYVGGSGPGNYTSIQDAIDNASDGDTVFVYDDSSPYYENVVVNKSINLIGEDKNTTIIDGSIGGDGVYVSADWVNISGFTIQNSSDGIDIRSNYTTITGNNISNNRDGISIYDSSSNIIKYNNILNNHDGIDFRDSNSNTITLNNILNNFYGTELGHSSNNTITGNNITSNNWYGIRFLHSSNNTITGNNISKNRYGIYLIFSSSNIISDNSFLNDGLWVQDSYQNTVSNNSVNGKPLVYLENESDTAINVDAGQVILINCDNITVQNQELSNTTVGIELWDTNNCLISDNNITSNNYGGIYFYSSSTNTVIGNTIYNNYFGIYLHSSSSNSITCNNITSNTYDGIRLWDSSNNNISGNSFFNDGLMVLRSYLNTVSNNSVNGKPLVYLENESDTAINVDAGQVILINCDNITVQNQELSNTTVGIELWDTNNCLISDNNITSNNDDGIYLYSSSNNTVNANNISNTYDGIYLRDSSNNNIKCNTISNNYYGIFLYSSSNNNITDNSVTSNKYNGVQIWDSSSNTITGNNISNNWDGVWLWTSTSNTITCNIISSNNYYGIDLSVSSNNTFMGNTISSNDDVGIFIYHSSSNNIIYHNNLINNTQNAYDECDNTWDDGYPSGGNFWDDYNGTDADGDGIGDTPYEIPGGYNEDIYPFMEPWVGGNLPPVAEFTWSPTHPEPEETILFNASDSYDPDGYITLYEWDWDNDGDYDESHTSPTATHSWSNAGSYPVTLRVTDNASSSRTKTKTVRVGNQLPNAPTIDGPTSGKAGVEYDYNFSLSDPDDDSMYLRVDWGSGTPGKWHGPFDSGATVRLNYSWNKKGTYTIRAQAIDIYDAEGDWGTLEVTMPKSKPFNFNFPLLSWLFERFPNAFPTLRYLLGLT